jgi:hypothetical protein
LIFGAGYPFKSLTNRLPRFEVLGYAKMPPVDLEFDSPNKVYVWEGFPNNEYGFVNFC